MEEGARVCYTGLEKNYIIHLVDKYKHIIECKSTDKVNCAKKKTCWEKITREFNIQPDVTIRKMDSLKKCWENSKRSTKKEVCNIFIHK